MLVERLEKLFQLDSCEVFIRSVMVLAIFGIELAVISSPSCGAFVQLAWNHHCNDMSLYHLVYVSSFGSSGKISVGAVRHPSTPRCNCCIRLAHAAYATEAQEEVAVDLSALAAGVKSFDRIYLTGHIWYALVQIL